MIRDWLLKHRWVNEIGKTIVASVFCRFSVTFWEAGKIASIELLPDDAYKLMIFGIAAALMGVIAVSILADVVVSLITLWRLKDERTISKPKQ